MKRKWRFALIGVPYLTLKMCILCFPLFDSENVYYLLPPIWLCWLYTKPVLHFLFTSWQVSISSSCHIVAFSRALLLSYLWTFEEEGPLPLTLRRISLFQIQQMQWKSKWQWMWKWEQFLYFRYRRCSENQNGSESQSVNNFFILDTLNAVKWKWQWMGKC